MALKQGTLVAGSVYPYHYERTPMQAVIFPHAKKRDGRFITHLFDRETGNTSLCGLSVQHDTVRYQFNMISFVTSDDLLLDTIPLYALEEAVMHHITCKNCLRGYK